MLVVSPARWIWQARAANYAAWLDSDRPDFVSRTDPSDNNFVSTGCATLFLNYLRHQLGFP